MATPSWFSSLKTASIESDMEAADVNGVVSAAGLTKLLTDLAATLSSSTLTTDEFLDLQTIAANLNNGLSTSSYLTYVFNALADGNAANANWTGGAEDSVTLGNLAAGATQTELDDLIGKWFLGTDLPSSYVNMSGYSPFTVTYSTVNSPLFGASGPSMNDINQGYLGDCFFLAPCAEVAEMNPGDIESMFTYNGNGTYGVRFYYDGAPEYVTVNLSLADGGTEFNSATDIWASLAEKAYAQFQAINLDTGNGSANFGNSWGSIGNGGYPADALEALTGATVITNYNADGSSWDENILNSSLNDTTNAYGLSTQSVLSRIETAIANHDDVVLSSNTDDYVNNKLTLVADHAMSIYGYDSSTGMLEIRNPWGTESGQYWDTTFEVSLAALLADDDSITLDNAGSSSPVTLPNSATVAQYLANVSGYDQLAGGFEILDVASAIAANLGRLDDPDITAITISDNGAIGVGVAELTSDAMAIGKLVDANGSAYQFAVSDTLAHVVAGLSTLEADAAHIASIAASGGAVTVSVSTFEADQGALDKIAGGFTIVDTAADISGALGALSHDAAITAITISDSAAVAVSVAALTNDATAIAKLVNANGSAFQLSVSDTAANISAGLATLEADGAHISSIRIADNVAVGASVAALTNDATAIGKFVNANGSAYQLAVSDTAADVVAGLSTLEADVPQIASIAATGGIATVSVSTFQADQAALDKIAGGFAIADTASDTSGALGALSHDGAITAITISDSAPVGVSVAELTSDAAALGLLANADGSAYRLTVADTEADLTANLATLIADLSHIASIAATDASMPLSAAEAVAFENAHVLLLAPTNDCVKISDTAKHLHALTAAELQGLAKVGVTGINDCHGATTFSAARTAALAASKIVLSAGGTCAIGATFTDGVTIAFGASASGGGALTLTAGAGVRVNVSSSFLHVAAGGETLALTPNAHERINATGRTGETFDFTTGFGNDVIEGFATAPSTHDTLMFSASAFGVGLTSAHPRADFHALMSATTSSGGNVEISDLSGDTLTLLGVQKGALTAADFHFV